MSFCTGLLRSILSDEFRDSEQSGPGVAKSVLKSYEAPIWAYQAAKDYAERDDVLWVRFDPKFRTDG